MSEKRKYRHVVIDAALVLHKRFSHGGDDLVFPYTKDLPRVSQNPAETAADHVLRGDAVGWLLAVTHRLETPYWSVDRHTRALDVAMKSGVDPAFLRSDNYLLTTRTGILAVDDIPEHRARVQRAWDACLRAAQDLVGWQFSRAPVAADYHVAQAHGFYMLDYLNDDTERLYQDERGWHRKTAEVPVDDPD